MTTVLLLAPAALPLLGAAVYLLAGWRPSTAWLAPACGALMLAAAVALAVTLHGTGHATALGGLVRVDPLSEYMLIVIGAVGLLATAATPAWLRGEILARRATVRTAARHSLLVQDRKSVV